VKEGDYILQGGSFFGDNHVPRLSNGRFVFTLPIEHGES
jgi:hypothetical protein